MSEFLTVPPEETNEAAQVIDGLFLKRAFQHEIDAGQMNYDEATEAFAEIVSSLSPHAQFVIHEQLSNEKEVIDRFMGAIKETPPEV